MIYPSDFESKIGFDSLRRLLVEKCTCNSGRDHAREMRFDTDFDRVLAALQQTDEMMRLLQSSAQLPGDTIYDIGPWLTELRADGNFISAERYHKLALMLETLHKLGIFFTKEDNARGLGTPRLAETFSCLMGFPLIVNEIDRCIDTHGEIKDTASDALYDIRRSIRSATGSIQSAMRGVIERAVKADIIDRNTHPTMRDGRMVLAVPAEKKRRLTGIIHDESATGKTVFIEPAEVVEASNRLRELSLEEHRQEMLVLIGLGDFIRPHIDAISEEAHYLGLLDFIRAKAHVAIETGAQMPVLERESEIDWYHALHPVLLLTLRKQAKEVVPLNLKLVGDRRILIISGPNAGGKSVALKTVGIIQYMTQCGMLPTVYSNSHVGMFDTVMADIGDEQSMENDLSTYSSHLRNMRAFLADATPRTLILADEMGTGTEPQIGGALAQAILTRLGRSGCFGVVTTHYQNLKTLADGTEGFVNGAMMYDRQHLQPTFQLSVGSAGSSFALEIARKIGLPPDVLSDAQEIVGSDYVNMDKYLLDVARDRRYWANKRQAVKEKEHKLDALLEQYELKAANLRRQRTDILNEARHEAREIMKGANARIERTIKEIKTADAEKERTRQLRAELEEYKRDLAGQEEDSPETLPALLKEQRHKSKAGKRLLTSSVAASSPSQAAITPGQYVKMTDGGVVGKVLSVSGKKAEVAFGALRTFVEIAKLKPSGKPAPSALSQVSSVSASTSDSARKRQLDFKQEIDVRGMRADEALQAVMYFLDDAVQFGAKRLRILHGTGHGILKTLIRQQLNANTAVVRFGDEDVRFGGAGITVVDLR